MWGRPFLIDCGPPPWPLGLGCYSRSLLTFSGWAKTLPASLLEARRIEARRGSPQGLESSVMLAW